MPQQLPPEEQTRIATEYVKETRQFNERLRALGYDEATRYYWYHVIDLGEGLVTPGLYDLRKSLDRFRFPENMSGMRVLDVGSATGFFSFEFARRGAQVTSVELPSLEALDRFPGQTVEQSIDKIERMVDPTQTLIGAREERTGRAAQYYDWLLEGPFQFCRERLQSDVQRCYATVYDLTPETVGADSFDLVFIGDVLLHTLNPLQALAAVVPLCSGTLVLSQFVPETADDRPAMLYVGGADPTSDDISWWWPNQACLVELLMKLGFREVIEAGRHSGILRSSGFAYERSILHARR
ncbi:MAG: methyltransferase domain-containing protein [Acidobacteria bacterium]|nr:methyltransferase domain-containing protein [Acidobacteriota bacterium]